MHEESYDRSAVASGRGQRGTLEQLPDGRWKARYREAGRAGKRPQRIFPRDEKRAATKWIRDGIEKAERIAGGDLRPHVQDRERATSCTQGVERFLATVDQAPASKACMKERLRVFEREFGTRRMQSLEPHELEAWRLTIKAGWRADVFRDTRRMLYAWKRWGWIVENPAEGIVNRRHRAPEVTPLAWDRVLAIAGEIDRRFEHVPILAAGTGLRPEEWIALERRDIDLEGRVLHVRRVYSSGRLVELGADGAKTFRQRRRVPLRRVVVDALRTMPTRIDTPLLVPPLRSSSTGYLTLSAFRDRYWRSAFDAAGLPYQRPYDMRHTYATESIAAGVGLFELSRFMGTSLEQIDRTYGHLVDDAEDRNVAALDAYDEACGRLVDAAGGDRP